MGHAKSKLKIWCQYILDTIVWEPVILFIAVVAYLLVASLILCTAYNVLWYLAQSPMSYSTALLLVTTLTAIYVVRLYRS